MPPRTGPYAGRVISRDLASRLSPLLDWTPTNGDQFFIPRPEISESVFTMADMVVELIVKNGDSRFHFNGTVEWALDSVESDSVVWMPREEQLRTLLGDAFLSLDRLGDGFVVSAAGPEGAFHTEPCGDACDAYAEALLVVLPSRPSGESARLDAAFSR